MDLGNRTLPLAQSLRMLIIWVLLFLINLHQGNCFLSGTPIGEVVPSNSKIIEGSNLTLNCTLLSYSVTPLNSLALYFIAVYNNTPRVIDASFYHILTDKNLQLLIPNVKREDGTTFKCHMNDSDLTSQSDTYIASATVYIGRPPDPIVNVSVVSDNFDNMTVNWCPPIAQPDVVDSHLSWAIDNSNLSGNCSAWKIISGFVHCACIFCGTLMSLPCSGKDQQSFYTTQTYNITITSSNGYGSTTKSLQVVADQTIVKPSPVGGLVATPLSSRSLQASWNSPIPPSVISLIYQVDVFSEWGLNSTIDAGPNISWVITDLTPSTEYRVFVRSKPSEDGYWSDESLASAETMEDAPAVAPESPNGFFRITSCSQKDGCLVTIFWKLINASLQNGVILGYRLTVESTHSRTDVEGGGSTSADVRVPYGVSSTVHLVAYTSVGDSPPHYIVFYSYFNSLPSVDSQGLYAEYTTEDKAAIFFSWNYVDDVDNYTLMYCTGTQANKTHCLSSPMSAILPRHQTNFTMSPYNTLDVYALAANYRNGTSGLTPNWICIYDYSGLPKPPMLRSITQVTTTSVTVVWSPLTCNEDNRVRVLNYLLTSCISNSTLDCTNVTLPGNSTEYTTTGLTPEVEYTFALRGVSRSGPGQATTDVLTLKTDTENQANIVIPVAVAVAISVSLIIVIITVVYACRKSHKWCNSVTITTPEKYENNDAVNETDSINNYAAISDSGNNLHTYADISMVSSASDMLDSQVPSCQNGLQNVLIIPNEHIHLEEELLVHSSSQNDVNSTTVTEQSESVDSISSNITTSTSCESDESIQTYTAVANPGASNDCPSSPCLLLNCSADGSHLPNHDDITLQPQPTFEDPTLDSSDSYGYSQAHQSPNVDSSVDSSGSCDDYMSGRFKEGSYDEPVGEPIAPQLA